MKNNSAVKISRIETDESMQCRARIETSLVDEYARQMKNGVVFPPVVLFGNAGKRTKLWIGDGWHRLLACRKNGKNEISADVRPGGRHDAIKHALQANAAHGKRRTQADKRRALEIAFVEFPKLSARVYAEMCGVSHYLAAMMLRDHPASEKTRVGRDGKTRRTKAAARKKPAKGTSDASPCSVLNAYSRTCEDIQDLLEDADAIERDDIERVRRLAEQLMEATDRILSRELFGKKIK